MLFLCEPWFISNSSVLNYCSAVAACIGFIQLSTNLVAFIHFCVWSVLDINQKLQLIFLLTLIKILWGSVFLNWINLNSSGISAVYPLGWHSNNKEGWDHQNINGSTKPCYFNFNLRVMGSLHWSLQSFQPDTKYDIKGFIAQHKDLGENLLPCNY